MSDIEPITVNVEEFLGLNKYEVDEEHPHIALVDQPDPAEFGKLVRVCPAALYKRKETGEQTFDYAGCLECGAAEGDGRTLPVGARDMHHGRQLPLGTPQHRQQLLDPREREIDDARMQRTKPRQQRIEVARARGHVPCLSGDALFPAGQRAGAGTEGSAAAVSGKRIISAGGLGRIKWPRRREMVSRNSLRGTTMSTMP